MAVVHTHPPLDPAADALFAGPGEMRRHCRAFDWAATSLGPVHRWPAALKTAVGIVMASPQSMWIGWGPDFVQIYNDVHASFSNRHPASLGQPVRETWPDIWNVIGPDLEQVRDSGIGAWHEARLIPLYRLGEDRERYFSVSYSAIPDRKAANTVGGVLAVATETTARGAEAALREGRATLALELEDARQLQAISSLLIKEESGTGIYNEILDAAMVIMRADFSSIQALDADRGELCLLAWKNFHPDAAAHWQRISRETGTTCGSALQHGERVVVPDVNADPSVVDAETLRYFRLCRIAAVQSTPLTTREGRVVGMMSTHWRTPHQPNEREWALFDALARQTADVLERHRTQEALRTALETVERLVVDRTAERDTLGRQLAQAEEAERRRIARELHDRLGRTSPRSVSG